MKINRVTLTGADDSIAPESLISLSEKYSLIEWGILLSSTSFGNNRFPSEAWLNQLKIVKQNNPGMKLSGHICGAWVREICKGDWSQMKEVLGDIFEIFDRFQLNFHAYLHKIDREPFLKGFGRKQYIFQLDDVNNGILDIAKEAGIDAVPLFDTSGGIGRLPESWPAQNGYSGYAGGLSVENLTEQLEKISKVADSEIWIDAETRVRSNNDQLFDLIKVEEFVKIAQGF